MPRPPAWICALTTQTGPPRPSTAARASPASSTARPAETGVVLRGNVCRYLVAVATDEVSAKPVPHVACLNESRSVESTEATIATSAARMNVAVFSTSTACGQRSCG